MITAENTILADTYKNNNNEKNNNNQKPCQPTVSPYQPVNIRINQSYM